MDVSYIMDSGQNRLYTTFPNIFSLLSADLADLSKIQKNHFSFWLNWNSDTLIQRIQKNTKRPIALRSSPNQLIDLIKKRSMVYSKSKYKINCEKLSKNEIVNKVINTYENKKTIS